MNGCFDPLFCPREKLQKPKSKRDTFKQPDKDSPMTSAEAGQFRRVRTKGGQICFLSLQIPSCPVLSSRDISGYLVLVTVERRRPFVGFRGRGLRPSSSRSNSSTSCPRVACAAVQCGGGQPNQKEECQRGSRRRLVGNSPFCT